LQLQKISPTAFEATLLRSWDWPATNALTNVNKVLEHINGGVLAALDIVALLRSITVRRGKNLYLAIDTLLNLMVLFMYTYYINHEIDSSE
jgi:hypothetical protein